MGDFSKEIKSNNNLLATCCNNSDCDCGCKCGQALCIANSVCASNITIQLQLPVALPLAAPSSYVLVTIPANSCITKIYASMPNAPTKAKYILIEVKNGAGTTIFCHGVPNTGNNDTEFDTTLVQPLCVGGPNDATATVTALDQNNMATDEFLTLTVVYCPNCC